MSDDPTARRRDLARHLAHLMPGADIQDYPGHDETTIIWASPGGACGHLTVSNDGGLRLSAFSPPLAAIQAFATTLAAP